MSKILSTPIGEFAVQTEQVLGKEIEACLGVPYATAAPFARPEPVDSYAGKPASL